MAFLHSMLTHLHHKSTPAVVAVNLPLNVACRRLLTEDTRFVQKIEICTALSSGDDAWGTPVDKVHHHTLLRTTLVSSSGDAHEPEDALLIERVLSTGGSYHSVTPIEETFAPGGTLFHPDVHDRVCVLSQGPSTALARDLQVERTLTFGDGSSGPCLTLAQFALILDLISRVSVSVSAGGDCKYQSRQFAFMCMAALTPALPPPSVTRMHKGGEAIGMNVKAGADLTDDTVFEYAAEGFLADIPWSIGPLNCETRQALVLMLALKDDRRASTSTVAHH